MYIVTRDFNTIVNAILNRITNADVGITNTSEGSIIRTLVEAIAAEIDMQYYQYTNIATSMYIDTATGEDLDHIVEILGITRKAATYATDEVTFYTSQPSTGDISISIDTIVSTKQDTNGDIIEFITTENATLLTGNTDVIVPIRARVAGHIYLPAGSIKVMNTPIPGISGITNENIISSGVDEENDDDFRMRARTALSEIGKGTLQAIENAVLAIDGVNNTSAIDKARGNGTVDLVVATEIIPPSSELLAEINDIINQTKSAGIDVDVVIPTINTVNINITTTAGTTEIIGNAVLAYITTLGISDSFIINQMERYVLNACNITNMDISTVAPVANVTTTSTGIIRAGTITINGVLWYD